MKVFLSRKPVHSRRHKALINGLAAFYLFAMVFLPGLHVHEVVAPDSACACESHPEGELPEHQDDDCDICRALHVTVPLLTLDAPEIGLPTESPCPVPPLLRPVVNDIHGVPSCRAPPASSV